MHGDCEMIDAILSRLGFKQKWHVSWVVTHPGCGETSCDGIFTFRPRFCAKLLPELREVLAEKTDVAPITALPEDVNIVSMTRIE